MSIGTIYKITCVLEGSKAYGKEYIGQTIEPLNVRWKNHKAQAKRAVSKKERSKFYNALMKYGTNNFTVEPIWFCSSDIEDIDFWEKHFIEERKTFTHGYNSTIGGQGTRCLTHSPETRAKISAANKGQIQKLREKYDHNDKQLPMYMTRSIPKVGHDGYKLRDHPFLNNFEFKSIEFTSKKLSMDVKLQMAYDILEKLNNKTYVDTRIKKTDVERGVQIMKDRGYQVSFNGHTVKTFASKKFTMDEKREMANEWARTNSHLYPLIPKERVRKSTNKK